MGGHRRGAGGREEPSEGRRGRGRLAIDRAQRALRWRGRGRVGGGGGAVRGPPGGGARPLPGRARVARPGAERPLPLGARELLARGAAPGGGRPPESRRASRGRRDGPTGLGRGVPGEPGAIRGLPPGNGEGGGRPGRLGAGHRGPDPVRPALATGVGGNDDIRRAPPLVSILPHARAGEPHPHPGGATTRRGRGSGVLAGVGPALPAPRGQPRVRGRAGGHLDRAGPGLRPERRPPRPVEPEGARGPGVRAARQGRERRGPSRGRECARAQPGDVRLPRDDRLPALAPR